jgi:hypothetical protein
MLLLLKVVAIQSDLLCESVSQHPACRRRAATGLSAGPGAHVSSLRFFADSGFTNMNSLEHFQVDWKC